MRLTRTRLASAAAMPRSMEEVEQPVVYVSDADTQFINPIPQQIGFRSPKLVSHFRQSFDGGLALRNRSPIFALHFAQPTQHRDIGSSRGILIKVEVLNLRHVGRNSGRISPSDDAVKHFQLPISIYNSGSTNVSSVCSIHSRSIS